MTKGVFAEWAPKCRQRELPPRPITPGTKVCHVPGWPNLDTEFDKSDLESQLSKYEKHGIGIRLGSPCPDETILGALDIDSDDQVRVALAALRDPPCMRVGARGAMIFVRISGDMTFHKITARHSEGGPVKHIGELLGRGRLAVLPPTIHPKTGKPYRWIGTPLLEVDFKDLPILEYTP